MEYLPNVNLRLYEWGKRPYEVSIEDLRKLEKEYKEKNPPIKKKRKKRMLQNGGQVPMNVKRFDKEGGIISGKTLKEYIENTNYGNDLSFVEYINDNDKFDLKNIDINAQIQKDGTLKDYVNNSEDFKPNEKETDWLNKTPIIIGDNSYENDVVLDGYHRIKQAQANKEKTILAYVKASNYADGGQVPMNVIRLSHQVK